MPTLTTRTANSYNIDLLVSHPDGQVFLCFQFQTSSGPSPVFSLVIEKPTLESLDKIQALIDSLAFTLQAKTTSFVDTGQRPERQKFMPSIVASTSTPGLHGRR